VARANTSGESRAVVASSASAFAPFSQNSMRGRCAAAGSGHAQPGQSKPFGWFIASSAFRAA